MKKLKVIVCGSTFGQFYIHALQKMSDQFELVGLFGKGSERSQKCAKDFGIPLFTDFEQIPKIDIACVVISSGTIGGIGTELSIRFMEKGVHVIQEQPIHPRDLFKCFQTAKKFGAYFKTCDLYPKLPEVKRFIRIAKELNKKEKPLYVKTSFCPQVSFPAIEILSRALDDIYSLTIDRISESVGPFDIATGKLGGIPFCLEYNNQVNTEDRDNYAHLLHSFDFVYETGRLSLEDTFGPVLWKPRMHVPKSLYDPENQAQIPDYVQENSIEILGDFCPCSFEKILFNDWRQGICENILELSDMILKQKNLAPFAQRELLCSTKWSELTTAMGFAKLIHPEGHHYIPSSEIKKFSGETNE